MTVLAVDTALGSCSAATVAGDGTCLARTFELRRKGHSEALPDRVAQVLAQAGLDHTDLTGLAASVGPGTFTGLRVGLSYARGLALSTGLPLAGVTTLAAVAADAAAAGLPAAAEALLVALTTKRRDYYLQLFRPASPIALGEPAALGPEAVAAWLASHDRDPASLALAGDASSDLAGEVPALAQATVVATPTGGRPDAATVARLAQAQGLPPADSAPPGPLYLRAPDVTPPPS